MATLSDAGRAMSAEAAAEAAEVARSNAVYADGIRAGLVGAATIALWFLLLDTIAGRPFYTPMVLGTAFLRGGEGLENPDAMVPSLELVLSFTWLHVLAFLLLGIATARLLAFAERNPSLGFGIVLLFAVAMAGFFFVCMMFAEPVLHAFAWWAIVAGNLLAALAMAWVLHRHRRGLPFEP